MPGSTTVQPSESVEERLDQWNAARRDSAILIVTTLDHPSDIALLRANAWAQVFGSQLHVLHVIRRGRRPTLVYPRHQRLEGLKQPVPLKATRAAIQTWLERIVGYTLPDERILIGEGTRAEQIVAAAHQLNASYVILGAPGEQHEDVVPRHCLRLAIPIAQRSQRQVLVARSPALAQRILAATDCIGLGDPVLEQARVLAERVGAKVQCLHNLTPAECSSSKCLGLGSSSSGLHGGDEIQTIVSHEEDPVEAILGYSQASVSDLIAVGAHTPHTAEDLPLLAGDGVASTVVRRASCSVLIVPLGKT